ncbi:hypothetical protein [Grimontia celer]|uniref:hypothetical protein n=1 Tax=Grimontia celer TaxID=1796497 RepID=UPI000789541C|nr:hypothetical protein [Grimontia celer]
MIRVLRRRFRRKVVLLVRDDKLKKAAFLLSWPWFLSAAVLTFSLLNFLSKNSIEDGILFWTSILTIIAKMAYTPLNFLSNVETCRDVKLKQEWVETRRESKGNTNEN